MEAVRGSDNTGPRSQGSSEETHAKDTFQTAGKKLVVSAGNKLYTSDSSGDRKVSAKPIDTTVSIVPALVGGQQRARVYQAVTDDDVDLLYLGGCKV